MAIDWSVAPSAAEAGSEESQHQLAAWYRMGPTGEVEQICIKARMIFWTSMGGRRDFPVGAELRPPTVLCPACSGYGTVHTGLMECPSTICDKCEGLGRVRA